jgi:hypothetical protein
MFQPYQFTPDVNLSVSIVQAFLPILISIHQLPPGLFLNRNSSESLVEKLHYS